MSKVIVFGATGYAGSNITTELVSRGHDVQGVARRSPDTAPEGVSFSTGSLHDAETVRTAVTGADVIVVSLPASATEDGGPRLLDSIPAVIDAAIAAGARLGVVGGAGSLNAYDGGPKVMDLEVFPADFRPEAQNHADVLEALREAPADLDWFYLSPAGGFGAWAPGERTGTFRLGGDVLLSDENHQSNISGADYAIAFVDEIEQPKHSRQRFSVAY
ncbi:NAD(P)-dependent oxidoreductase [Arthrobacter sp. MDT1-48-3]